MTYRVEVLKDGEIAGTYYFDFLPHIKLSVSVTWGRWPVDQRPVQIPILRDGQPSGDAEWIMDGEVVLRAVSCPRQDDALQNWTHF